MPDKTALPAGTVSPTRGTHIPWTDRPHTVSFPAVEPRSADHFAFGSAIRELREERGMSQEELALRSDMDRSYAGGVERGERNVSLSNILKIVAALEVSTGDLFTRFEKLRGRGANG